MNPVLRSEEPCAPFCLSKPVSGVTSEQRPSGATASLSSKGYTFLQNFVQTRSGIVLDDSKHYLLEARLRSVLTENSLSSLEELVTALTARPTSLLARQVIDAMTTNETLFFRDVPLFDALRKEILAEHLVRTAGKRKLRIWSAASSSGQEAYSLAMILVDMGYTSQNVEIVGTDLCSKMVERARQGRYVQFEVNRGLPAPALLKHFTRVGMNWQLSERVKAFTTFAQMDLRDDAKALGQFDLILCRNVLIYFDQATKIRIVQSLHSRLTQTGCLILGCAETLFNIPVPFVRRTAGPAAYYCRP